MVLYTAKLKGNRKMQQATVKSSFYIEGVGVHSGKTCRISVNPADENTGIVYIIDGSKILARYDNVSDTTLSTKISDGNTVIMTIEHLSAALYALGITNARIELSSNEIPILDGSAKIFVEHIQQAGVEKQPAKYSTIKILKEISVADDKKYVMLSPDENFIISVSCDFSFKGLNTQPEIFNFQDNDFVENIALARTFGFMKEVEHIRACGLAKGASLENTVVFDEHGVPINVEGLRLPNEPVKHKLLDVIGDLSLAGGVLQGKYEAFCPGHHLNNKLLRKLFSDSANYEII